MIPLDRSGRNPEVEEVLGALSLLLNGGGVAQLKTIPSELNKALDGREDDVRSLLDQLHEFMGQLDDNKDDDRRGDREPSTGWRSTLKRAEATINARPRPAAPAVDSINRQRDDLVKMLEALDRLSPSAPGSSGRPRTATVDSLQRWRRS